jgi:hypothetical protein
MARALVAGVVSDREAEECEVEEVYVVWFCYILGGWKSLLSTDRPDGRYYEVTFDTIVGRYYVDTYVKESNIPIDEEAVS